MNISSLNTLGTLFTLLPGLLTYLVVHFLTARERKLEATEAVLMGLGFTVIVNTLYAVAANFSKLPAEPNLPSLTIIALTIGLVVSISTNNGLGYAILRKSRLTKESSWRSTWVTALKTFDEEGGDWVFVYLSDGSRLLGAVAGYSSDITDGHLALQDCSWVKADDEKIKTPGVILIPGEQIVTLQLLTPMQEPLHA